MIVKVVGLYLLCNKTMNFKDSQPFNSLSKTCN